MFVVYLFMFTAIVLVSWAWLKGINNMKKNYPDYKGEDFLNCHRKKNTDWDKVPTNSGMDGWDDNMIHSEGDF